MNYVIEDEIKSLHEQVKRYLADINQEEWEKNEVVIQESTPHKPLMQTALRMKNDRLPIQQISRYIVPTTGEIEEL